MKWLLLAMLLVGCSSTPYDITRVRVGDKLEVTVPTYNDQLKGCFMQVDNILTKNYDKDDNLYVFERGGIVCGKFDCGASSWSREYTCLMFDMFQVEKPTRQDPNARHKERD